MTVSVCSTYESSKPLIKTVVSPDIQEQLTFEEDADARRVMRVDGSGNIVDDSLTITNAIDQTAFDLQAAAFSATTNVSNDFIFDSIVLNFSTTESKTITITGPDGTILLGGTVDTSAANTLRNTTKQNFNLIFQQGFNGGDNITVDVTTTSGACSMDCILKVKQGTAGLSGDPVLGSGDNTIGRVKITDGTEVVNVTTNNELEVFSRSYIRCKSSSIFRYRFCSGGFTRHFECQFRFR